MPSISRSQSIAEESHHDRDSRERNCEGKLLTGSLWLIYLSHGAQAHLSRDSTALNEPGSPPSINNQENATTDTRHVHRPVVEAVRFPLSWSVKLTIKIIPDCVHVRVCAHVRHLCGCEETNQVLCKNSQCFQPSRHLFGAMDKLQIFVYYSVLLFCS